MHILLEGSAYWLNWLHLICIVLQCTSLYGSPNLTQDCCFAANPCGRVSSRISELVCQGIFSSGNGLLHLPDQIVLYRPLRHHWCMHFEAKNRFIKQRKWWQLVNIWWSLARYNQIYMIYRQIGCLDELLQNYLYSSNIFCEGELALTTVFHPASLCRFHMQLVMHFLPGHGKMCGVERGNKSKCTTLRSKNCYILWDRSIDNFHLIFLLWNDSIQPIPLKFLSIPHLHLQQTDKGESIWPMQAWIIRC